MPSPRLTFALLALLPITSGCVTAAVGGAAAVGVTAAQERTAGEAFDDATASNEIKAKLLSEGGMGEVDVEVAGGLVLLSGRVMTPEQRVRAESIAWSSTRADDVANEIAIEPPGGFFKNASDELISARVRSRLLGSSSVQARNFNVETYGGVVYLMGIARSEKELRKAAEEASYAGGVQRVVSYIRLRNERGQIEPYRPQEEPAEDPLGLLGGPLE